jgi:hypothetical protein
MPRGIDSVPSEADEAGSATGRSVTDSVPQQARTSRTLYRAVGTTVVLALLGTVGLMACATSRGPAPTPSQSQREPTRSAAAQLTYFDVPTLDWHLGEPGWQALTRGILRFTADGCPYLDGSEHRPPTLLVFPDGARGVNVPGGGRSVADPHGRLYGTEGASVQFAGGGPWQRSVQNPCAGPNGATQRAWAVQDAARGVHVRTNG